MSAEAKEQETHLAMADLPPFPRPRRDVATLVTTDPKAEPSAILNEFSASGSRNILFRPSSSLSIVSISAACAASFGSRSLPPIHSTCVLIEHGAMSSGTEPFG